MQRFSFCHDMTENGRGKIARRMLLSYVLLVFLLKKIDRKITESQANVLIERFHLLAGCPSKRIVFAPPPSIPPPKLRKKWDAASNGDTVKIKCCFSFHNFSIFSVTVWQHSYVNSWVNKYVPYSLQRGTSMIRPRTLHPRTFVPVCCILFFSLRPHRFHPWKSRDV